MTTKIKAYQIENDGWTPFLGTMPVFVSTTDGIDSLTLALANDFLSTSAKVELTSGAGTHMYYLLFADATGFELVGETSPSGTITAMRYSYADAPFGFKKGEDWYKVRVHSAASQSLVNDSTTDITLDVEDFDPNGNFTGNAYTVPITGTYIPAGSLTFASNSSGYRRVDIDVDTVDTITQITQPVSTTITITGTSDTIELNRGDVVKLQGRQTSGGSLSVLNAQNGTYLSLQFTGI